MGNLVTMALDSGVANVIDSGMSTVQGNVTGVISQATPYIFGVLGVSIALTVVIRWVKKIKG